MSRQSITQRSPIFFLLLLAASLSLAACSGADESSGSKAEFLKVEEIIIALLFIAALVGIAAKRLRVPYTIGLVLMGSALALRGQADVVFLPNLILGVLVPPLIFEAAFHLNLAELRRNLVIILIMAVPGVIITTLLVGWLVSLGTGIAILPALLFGAIVSATDPVSVIALLRASAIPNRLQVLLEGESLLNDGTAIVVYNILLAAVLAAGLSGVSGLNLPLNIAEFAIVSGGGLVIGLALGSLISQVISRIDDYLIETTLTTVLAYGAYLIAEMIGVSGVLAVLAAGLVNGNIGPKQMSPTTRIVVYNFWEYTAFLANTFVYLLIGLNMNLNAILTNWQAIIWAILAVLAARSVTIYGLAAFTKNMPFNWHHVLFWGGLRGAISLALALSLPASLGNTREFLLTMTFGVVLFTLLGQGLTMSPLVRLLRLVQRGEVKAEYQRRHARAVAGRVAYEHLDRMNRQGLISDHTWHNLSLLLKEHNRALVSSVREVLTDEPKMQTEELLTAHREYLRSQRSVFSNLLRDGVISSENYARLTAEVDSALAADQSYWPEMLMDTTMTTKTVNRLITAIVQEQDIENAINALDKLGFSLTRLPSSGGFLGRRNATLLIGLARGQEAMVTHALYQSCRTRVEYVTLPLEGSPMPLPTPTPITVGGATIFAFDVERYEEF